MPPDIGSSVVSAVIGGVVTLIVTFVLYHQQKEKRIIEYHVHSMPLLRFRPNVTHALSVAVYKEALTGDKADQGMLIPVNSAYGFEITARNIGNRSASNPVFFITLDSSARIVEYDIQPSSSEHYRVDFNPEPNHPNMLCVALPYLNENDEVIINAISIGNKTVGCEVKIAGEHIHGRASRSNVLMEIAIPLVLVLIGTVLLGLTVFLPSSIRHALGWHSETIKHLAAPAWLYVVAFGLTIVGYLTGIWKYASYQMHLSLRSRRSFGLRWDGPKSQSALLKFLLWVFRV